MLTNTSFTTIHSDPLEIGTQARDEVDGSWESIHVESDLVWADREEKKQIMFNNYNSFFEYRLTIKKKANTNKVETKLIISLRVLSSLVLQLFNPKKDL